MLKKTSLIALGLFLGLVSGYLLILNLPIFPKEYKDAALNYQHLIIPQKQVVGFLPYFLLDNAQSDYSNYLTTLTYFGLTIDNDGSILKLSNPGEEEPGWLDLDSGKAEPFLQTALSKNMKLSLLVFSGDEDSISSLMTDPVSHADNLIDDVTPIMRQHNFTDLNLDVESSKVASDEARQNFTAFTKELKKGLVNNNLGTLTIEISPTAFVKNYLIDPQAIANLTDYLVIMGYDYHFTGSLVTGPVAPLYGAGTLSELDVSVAIQKALAIMPPSKIILGAPLYGYQWETIDDATRSATIPSSGQIATDTSVEQLLQSCTNCSSKYDTTDQEENVIYQDQTTGTFHQIFYPDIKSMQAKVDFATKQKLAGIALWALGYENSDVLNPLKNYKNSLP